MEGDLTQQQMEKVLKLCDILAIEDFQLGILMMKECNWNLEKALEIENIYDGQNNYQPAKPEQTYKPNVPPVQPPKPIEQPKAQVIESEEEKVPVQQNPYNLDNNELQYYNDMDEQQANNYQYDMQFYQQQFERERELQNKKKLFNEGFISMPLVKTKSDVWDEKQHKLQFDKEVSLSNLKHRFQYQMNLLENSVNLCSRILNLKSPEIRKCYDNPKKNENNRKFLLYLHKKYETKINFTFGTFLLNLARSYLDKKYLLVYIHKSEFEDNKSINLLLNQPQIVNFLNKHCINYGMFDSSDDYEILHQYIPMKDLPAFAVFKLNKQELKEQYLNHYPVLQSEPQNFLNWLASNIGVSRKKVQVENIVNTRLQQKKVQEEQLKRMEMASIRYEQNLQYEQMARLYQLKRQKSKARKESLQIFEQQIARMKEKFKDEPAFEPGVTVQFRFRLPITGNSIIRVFKLSDSINQMFEFIHCFGRDEFEERLAQFDLTQTFPKLSLMEKKGQLISAVFSDSERENIIVKEL